MTFGTHLVIDAKRCTSLVRRRDFLEHLNNELLQAIKMKPYGPPTLAHFALHDPKAGGWTLVQLIETSSITGHFVDETCDAYLDVFSCKDFDCGEVEDLVRSMLKPHDLKLRRLDRG